MILDVLRWLVLIAALAPLAYYVVATYCGWFYFRSVRKAPPATPGFTPPVSILKPVRGLDHEAYEKFASFCRLDYPQYEILFVVVDSDDPVIAHIANLHRRLHARALPICVRPPVTC